MDALIITTLIVVVALFIVSMISLIMVFQTSTSVSRLFEKFILLKADVVMHNTILEAKIHNRFNSIEDSIDNVLTSMGMTFAPHGDLLGDLRDVPFPDLIEDMFPESKPPIDKPSKTNYLYKKLSDSEADALSKLFEDETDRLKKESKEKNSDDEEMETF